MISFKADNILEMATNFAIPSEVEDTMGGHSTLSILQLMLDLSHMILCCVQVRYDSPDAGYSRQFPLATFMASLITCLAGGILSNLLLGLPLLNDLNNGTLFLSMLMVSWYLVFYSPFDVFYRLCTSNLALKLPLSICKELGRARKISKGIALAHSMYPGCLPVMLIIGTVKGCGSSFMRPFALLIQGCSLFERDVNEFTKPSFPTKAGFLSCCLLSFAFTRTTKGIAGLGYPQLVFVVSLLLVYAKVAVTLLKLGDPLRPLENLFCWIIFGRAIDGNVNLKKAGDDISNPMTSPAGPMQQPGSVPASGPQMSRTSTMQSALSRQKME